MRDLRIRHLVFLLLGAAAILLGVRPGAAQTGDAPSSLASTPSDIDPQSGFRLPLPRREDLDEAGKRTYDRASTPGASVAGLQGPAGIQLYSPRTTAHLEAINRYLRSEAGIPPRIREIAREGGARVVNPRHPAD